MRIRYLNGVRLKRAFIAGARRVIQHREYLNRINVFPVADSDTGTNLAGTLQSMINSLLPIRDLAAYPVARLAADSALDAARGNSGTILAQFIHGFAEGIHDEMRITTSSFSAAVLSAVEHAYKAMANPKEGTILTVLHEWSHALSERGRQTNDFVELLSSAAEWARKSLARTKDGQREMRAAGVVDAGAQGFFHMLEGINHFIGSGTIREIEGIEPDYPAEEQILEVRGLETLTYRFCTECVIAGEQVDHDVVREQLLRLGDSLIVAGSPKKTKIHIHTDEPAEVFRLVGEFGSVLNEKIDDMKRQISAAHGSHGDCVIVVDSTCDLPADILDDLNIHMVHTRLTIGDTTYIDRAGISPREFYRLMRRNPDLIPTTTQPPPADFRRKFEFLSAHYKSILYVGLASTLSGTIQSALNASRTLGTCVTVFDSLSISIGLGLVVRRVGEAIRDGASLETAVALAKSLLSRTYLYLTVPSMKALIRSGRIGKRKGGLVDRLGLKPILQVTQAGRVVPITAALSEKASWSQLVRQLKKRAPRGSTVDFAVAHASAPEAAEWLAANLRKEFSFDHEPYIIEAAPVLAAHTGLGTVGIALTVP